MVLLNYLDKKNQDNFFTKIILTCENGRLQFRTLSSRDELY